MKEVHNYKNVKIINESRNMFGDDTDIPQIANFRINQRKAEATDSSPDKAGAFGGGKASPSRVVSANNFTDQFNSQRTKKGTF
mmetsp:Transcript_30244/g.46256  ORF Transcript_30244/g.46256 Transcript_30244/m.46256 type:complete len:83 (-) Transcript_30244:7196-7444(-)